MRKIDKALSEIAAWSPKLSGTYKPNSGQPVPEKPLDQQVEELKAIVLLCKEALLQEFQHKSSDVILDFKDWN